MFRKTALLFCAAACLGFAACDPKPEAVVVSPPTKPKPSQTLALNVDFNCRRDDEEGVANFISGCAANGVTRLNFRALMMGLTEHPSKVRLSWGKAAPDHVDPEFDLFKIAVKYCKKEGIECWVFFDLFDTRNDLFAKEHPEFRLVSRDGKETCQGGLCFAYPEVRDYYDRYVDELLDYGVDGFMFCTKSRHGMPLTSKFGFNDPVVAEFKKRHGVDVRKEKFDSGKWLDLQGEYIVSWVKQATERIHKRGGRTSMTLPGRKRNHYANIDWREVVKQKAVDELHTSCWRGEELHLFGEEGLKRLLEYVDVCHANGVKYVPYLFADMTFRKIYEKAGLAFAASEAVRWVRHVRTAKIDGVLFHDMEIFLEVVPPPLRDDIQMALIGASGRAMNQRPEIATPTDPDKMKSNRKEGEILFNSNFHRRFGAINAPADWLIRKGHACDVIAWGEGVLDISLSSPLITNIESLPAYFPRNSTPDPKNEKNKIPLPTPYRLKLVAGADKRGVKLEVYVFRYLKPPVDYDTGRHLLHWKQRKIDSMFKKQVELPVGDAKTFEFDFTGGGLIDGWDGTHLLVRLSPSGEGMFTLKECSLKKRDE